jgi:transposase-like protein
MRGEDIEQESFFSNVHREECIPRNHHGRRWMRAERGPTTASTAKISVLNLTDQTELLRLRKENERLKMEREILKKAVVSSTGQCNTQ